MHRAGLSRLVILPVCQDRSLLEVETQHIALPNLPKGRYLSFQQLSQRQVYVLSFIIGKSTFFSCTGVISKPGKYQSTVDNLFIRGKKKQFIFLNSEITDTLSSKCYKYSTGFYQRLAMYDAAVTPFSKLTA